MEKAQIIKQIVASLSKSLGVLEKAARASHAEATHESSKAETISNIAGEPFGSDRAGHVFK